MRLIRCIRNKAHRIGVRFGMFSALSGIVAFAFAQPDLVVLRVLDTNAPSHPFTLQVFGTVDVVIENSGTSASTPCSVVVFTDVNGNKQYDAGTDILLGTGSVPAIGANLTATVSVLVSGRVLFGDGWISAYVDNTNVVSESDETNNYNNTGSTCGGSLRPGTLNPRLKWHWGVDNPNNPPRGQDYSDWMNVGMTPVIIDMDRDGYAEVVFAGTNQTWGPCTYSAYIFVLDGRDGSQKYVSASPIASHSTHPAAGDLDGDGYPEVVFAGMDGRLCFLRYDISTSSYTLLQTGATVPNAPYASNITIANLDLQGAPEIILGDVVLNSSGNLLWSGELSGCYSLTSLVADVDLDGAMEIVAGRTVYNANGTIKHQNTILSHGSVATANFDADDQAEIVLVSNSRVYILEHNLTVVRSATLPGGGFGGPPMIGDFDGDSNPEIAVAGALWYVVFHSTDLSILWQAPISDVSSARTGGTLFDFNGDGRPEAIYRDETHLRIYDGPTGQVIWEVPASSCTWTEYVQVADIDSDGNADLVAVTNNNCGRGPQRGIYVFSDPTWFPTRKIWNQHHYCITNINDDGSVPTTEPPSWLLHNTYRLNPSFNPDQPLPDLTISVPRYCASTPDRLQVRVGNGGGADVTSAFTITVYNGDPNSGGVAIGSTTLTGMPAGQFADVVINISSPNPRWVKADSGLAIDECDEQNNLLLAFTGCGADINRDGIVDDADLLLILFDFGSTSVFPFYLPTDINCDGQVDDEDLQIALQQFGYSCE